MANMEDTVVQYYIHNHFLTAAKPGEIGSNYNIVTIKALNSVACGCFVIFFDDVVSIFYNQNNVRKIINNQNSATRSSFLKTQKSFSRYKKKNNIINWKIILVKINSVEIMSSKTSVLTAYSTAYQLPQNSQTNSIQIENPLARAALTNVTNKTMGFNIKALKNLKLIAREENSKVSKTEVDLENKIIDSYLSTGKENEVPLYPYEERNIPLQKKKRHISGTIWEKDSPKKIKIGSKQQQIVLEEIWDDLDEEDLDDPLMVFEYVQDIFTYLHELELITLPNKQKILRHKNIRENRDILIDWLVKIHVKFQLLPETLFLAINLIDRFLTKESVQLDKLQLVGTSCLFIASKYEEIYCPSIKNFANETDGACSTDDIKKGEKYILKALDFNLNYPNPMNFLRRISKADDYDIQSRTLAKFLLEITIIDCRFIGILPSLCAAAAMFISRKMLGKCQWDRNLIHYCGGYRKEDLQKVCELIMDYLIEPTIHEEFIRKYRSRKFLKASIISVQWAKKVRENNLDLMTLHE
ncbi:B-type cyclin CLB1 NDAI_0G01110 [Naumovozyma dairenensis CBS 421]|uniref:Uncharacterized protein n=1 Tax=Naumovozyma dairenensis (strain ATCC 10597 / BCRC 20456 / CBS 421 / NBRC 0211 / NRRL Y-12639) TaxID=1071378 RepID=G0WDM6_NAUDC|nr:hypothetical protein NDAI_0G01110 [Naumovozyma dairenensis CBS 421]CCD25887.2 hypothetical protein NDAI_0G01110 [Naumovozyma dairenensis CBS 421]